MIRTPSEQYPVVIVGGGWAGLAAAVTLSTHKIPICLIESARQTGGRARSVRVQGKIVDNGQHLMLGACESLLTLMQTVAINLDEVFLRIPMALIQHRAEKINLRVRVHSLPAPFHLLTALLTAQGLSMTDRLKAVRFGHNLKYATIQIKDDISVQAWLHSKRQTPALIRKLWQPLCISMLNMSIQNASARLFLSILRESFLGLAKHTDLLFPKQGLNEIIPQPCMEFLERNKAHIILAKRVTNLNIEESNLHHLYIGNNRVEASHVILATPHIISRRLLMHHPMMDKLCANLAQLGNEPIVTIYLQYPETVHLQQPMIGLQNQTGQWVFDRASCGQAGLMAVVISGAGEHIQWSNETLGQHISDELATCFPTWPKPLHNIVIREKRATFSSRIGIDAFRPGHHTPVPNLWLAGDYTANNLPATLEGAVRSGIGCAHQVLQSIK